MAALQADSALQYLKGVGPQRAEHLAELGLRTVGDLLEYFPFRYEVEQGEVEIADLVPGTHATVQGEVVSMRRRPPGLLLTITDGSETCVLRWFNRAHGTRGLAPGAHIVAAGKVQLYKDRPELVQPRIEVLERDALVLRKPGGARRVGVYRGSKRVSSPLLRTLVRHVFDEPRLPVDEVLPPALRQKHGLPTRAEAVRQMHQPAGDAELERARRRLVYEEFLLLELAMALRRQRCVALQKGRVLQTTKKIDQHIRARFPFDLTAAQDTVIAEIVADLASGRPMTRLLQGDVGSGKTVVALYAALVAIAHGRQAAIMAPTEILARQHHANVTQYLRNSRVRVELLHGGRARGERIAALAAIERGDVDLVVGTQALIQQGVAFADLALVVVDEQHKFGVVQRHAFRTKGPMPHYLVMTATPIPRTLSMTVFGDLDVSVLKQGPPGRGTTSTHVVTASKWSAVMRRVRRRLEAGEQAYVVCPVIDDAPSAMSDDRPLATPLLSVRAAYTQLVDGPWHGLNVGLLHGALPARERQDVVDRFVAGDLHAVVATTVVEVGVDVPNATVMIIEHAERFGLSQLHQLRGRVGRGAGDGVCVLVARGRGRKAAERLAVMTETADGFRIAEADLWQRGPGELLGTRQHGLPELRVGSLVDDFDVLEAAREDAFALVAADPALADPAHQVLLPALKRMFGGKLALIDVA